MPELPDWLRGFALLGKHGTDYVVVAVDEDGQLYALVRGIDGEGDLHTLAVDDEGQLIMVPRGATGNYLAVDSDGYLTAVFKGDYAGALRTVTLDDEGRISAFIYDTLDAWGQVSTIGFAELAARLGSPVTFERSGQVFLMESFEHGLVGWRTLVQGDDANVSLDPTASRHGGYSVRLTGGKTSPYRAAIYWDGGAFPSGRAAVSVSFSKPSAIDLIQVYWLYWSGTISSEGGVQLRDTDDKLYVQESAGWTEVSAIGWSYASKQCFNTIKVVFDLDNREYVKARLNAQEFDLSAYTMANPGTTASPYIQVQIHCISRSGSNDVIYVDSVAFTFAEPE